MEVDVFHIGPQKSATSWLYYCLKEHDEVTVAKTDAVHYYDIFYHRGRAWYDQRFPASQKGQQVIDFTPSYIRSPWAPRRIYRDHPEAKLILCLRNPVDRAFSHYWHEKKKQKIAFEFAEVLENYDLFSSWIEPGLYAQHIERYLQFFDREQFLFLEFEQLESNPDQFLRNVLEFMNVDTDFTPSLLQEKVNRAGSRQNFLNEQWKAFKRFFRTSPLAPTLRKIKGDKAVKKIETLPLLRRSLNNKKEYKKGMTFPLRKKLIELIEPEIARLEKLLDKDFTHWRRIKK